MRTIDVNDESGAVIQSEWLAKAEAVHRQLRPHLPADYAGKMRRVFAGGGRLAVAVRDGEVCGVAVHRTYENTFDGLHMYCDDLVTDERQRSSGVGKSLLDHMRNLAKARGCLSFTLDSGTQRHQAHKFYFREGMVATSLHFVQELKG